MLNTRQRFCAIACGHAVCSGCAVGADSCRVCDKPSALVRLFEDEKQVVRRDDAKARSSLFKAAALQTSGEESEPQ